MIERVPGIYEITLCDTMNTVNSIQVYLIPGGPGQRSLLIDTGFENRESWETLRDAFVKLSVSCKDLDVFLTHKHHDHTGLAGRLAREGARIFMNPEEDRHPYDCLYYTRSQKALDEQFRVLKTVGVTRERTPKLWEDFMELNRQLRALESARYQGKSYPYEPAASGQIFGCGPYTFEAVPLKGHTFGQMGLFDREHSILFSADQIIDGIVPIVATAYMNEHLLSLYFQSLESFEKTYGGCTVYPAHNGSFDNASPIIDTIKKAYGEKLDRIRHILAFGTKPMTIQEIAFLTYGIRLLPGCGYSSQIYKIKMILTKTFSCLEYLYDMGECSRICRDGILYWSRESGEAMRF